MRISTAQRITGRKTSYLNSAETENNSPVTAVRAEKEIEDDDFLSGITYFYFFCTYTPILYFLPELGTRLAGSTGIVENRSNRPNIFRLNRENPEYEKTGAFQPEPLGKFPVEPGKTRSALYYLLIFYTKSSNLEIGEH